MASNMRLFTEFGERFPSTLNEFLSCVLETRDHTCSGSTNRLVNSYGSDLIHGVTRGKVITLQHFFNWRWPS